MNLNTATIWDAKIEDIRSAGRAVRHAAYSRHGNPADPGRKLNAVSRITATAPRSPGPIDAFSESVERDYYATLGRTQMVGGYSYVRGGKTIVVERYYRKPRRTWLGTISSLGTIAEQMLN